MKNLKIYRVSNDYIKYLSNIDSKVQYNKNAKRPYVGIVFVFNGFNYFVPMESPKERHKSIKPGKHILKLDKGNYGMLGFNNMIPVPMPALIDIDINAEKDEKYRRLLQH